MSSHNQSYSTNSLPSFINTSIPSPAHQHQSLHFHFNKNIYFTQKHIPSMISSFPKQNMIGFQMHLSPFFRFRKMKLFSDPLFSFPIHFSAAIHREAYMTFTWLHVDRWGRQILSFFWSSSFRVQIVQKCFSLVIPLVINRDDFSSAKWFFQSRCEASSKHPRRWFKVQRTRLNPFLISEAHLVRMKSRGRLCHKIVIFRRFFQAVCLVGAHTFRSAPHPGHTPRGHTCLRKVVRPRSDI